MAEALLCGTKKCGLTKTRFEEIATLLRAIYPEDNRPAAHKQSMPWGWLWKKAANTGYTYTFTHSNNPYTARSVTISAFNGCSSWTVNGFCDLCASIYIGHFTDHPTTEKITPQEMATFALYTLYMSFQSQTPFFFNLPPRQQSEGYNFAYEFMEAQGAEVACQFVNPNYPEREDRKEYTTLFVMDSFKFRNPNSTTKYFKGLVK